MQPKGRARRPEGDRQPRRGADSAMRRRSAATSAAASGSGERVICFCPRLLVVYRLFFWIYADLSYITIHVAITAPKSLLHFCANCARQ